MGSEMCIRDRSKFRTHFFRSRQSFVAWRGSWGKSATDVQVFCHCFEWQKKCIFFSPTPDIIPWWLYRLSVTLLYSAFWLPGWVPSRVRAFLRAGRLFPGYKHNLPSSPRKIFISAGFFYTNKNSGGCRPIFFSLKKIRRFFFPGIFFDHFCATKMRQKKIKKMEKRGVLGKKPRFLPPVRPHLP